MLVTMVPPLTFNLPLHPPAVKLAPHLVWHSGVTWRFTGWETPCSGAERFCEGEELRWLVGDTRPILLWTVGWSWLLEEAHWLLRPGCALAFPSHQLCPGGGSSGLSVLIRRRPERGFQHCSRCFVLGQVEVCC